jgi:hypothetical protein
MITTSEMQISDWITLSLGLAAFITAIFSNKISRDALKITVKQRRAEFQKERIENLRNHIVEFRTASYSRAKAKERLATYTGKSKNIPLAREWREKYAQFTAEVVRHNAYLRLCLNEDVQADADLIKKMKSYVDEKFGIVKNGPRLNELAKIVLQREIDKLENNL